jgi:phospholipid/cholesterol/gamma-HCH transport system permease protein
MNISPGVRKTIEDIGGSSSFFWRAASSWFKPPFEWNEFIKQCYYIGYKSLPLIGLTGFIMGLVITMQLRPAMTDYGAEAQIPEIVGIAIIREIGPVITALIFAGKIGSSIGAELASMKVTEQIDAMEVSGTNPFKYLVITRIFATTFMLPILVLISDAISLYGSFLGVNINGHIGLTLFINQVIDSLSFSDFVPAIVKSFFFGMAVGVIGCYMGYTSSKGTEGVGKSANSAVVTSSIVIFIIDLIAVQITALLGYN